MKLKAIKVYEGEVIPKWYGFAWREYAEAAIVVYPIPFNFVARFIRYLYFSLSQAGAKNIDKNYMVGYERGKLLRDTEIERSYQRGYKNGQEDILGLLRQTLLKQ